MPDERGDPASPRGGAFGLPEAVMLAVVGFGVAATWILQLAWVPGVTQMFDDFGGPLPAITMAAIRPVLALGGTCVAVPLAATGMALRAMGRRRRGTVVLGVAALVAAVLPFAIAGAVYYAIFAVASVIR